MLAQKKISTKKEWGWRPILLALHELKMWVFAAKENNQYFKLHGDALKSGCYAYYNTFGDSPLTRITGKEFDETTMDALSWEITVYGDFYIQNAPQALGHTKTLLKGLKAWKDGGKKNVQTATGP